MATINIGYRKLFQIQGCEIDTNDSGGLTYELDLSDDLTARISIGPSPALLTPIPPDMSDTHMMQTEEGRVQGQFFVPPLPTGPDIVYLDILVFQPTTIPDNLFAAWRAGEEAANRILRLLAEGEETVTHAATDILATMMGLRFHRQLVFSPKVESPYVEGGEWCNVWPAVSFGELLRHLEVSYETLRRELLTRITPREFARIAQYRPVLAWLLKAWGERDSLYRFLALFIAMEQLLEHYTTSNSPEMPEEAKVIKRLITRHADAGEKNALLSYYDKMYTKSMQAPRNSLSACFARLAASANFPTKEEDIATFERAREKRNMLMHEGEEITVFGKRANFQGNTYPFFAYNEYSELDSLVARYVMWEIYQEHAAYPATTPPPPL